MTEAMRRVWLLGFLLLCSCGTLVSAWQIRHWQNALSPADPYSEANALREVDGFRAQGIGHDEGLGNVLFGTSYPHDGFAGFPDDLARSVAPGGVYTHYPPGPEYLLYAAEALFGPAPVSRVRIFPLVLCWGAAVFFGFSLRRRFGATVGWLVMLACATVPAFYDANSSVHFLGYALALLLVEIGIGVGRNRATVPFLLLGFLQGWLSFDYGFLVVSIPLALELALPCILPAEQARIRLALLRCVLAGVGFAGAHLLHFGQVWAYYGSLAQALADLHSSANFRSGTIQPGGLGHSVGAALLVVFYYVLSPYPISLPFYQPDADFADARHIFRFLGLTLGLWWLVLTPAALLAMRRRWRGWLAVSGLGLGPCCLWWLAMHNHAALHIHLMYRHLFFCFFLWVLFWAVRVASRFDGRDVETSVEATPENLIAP